MRHAQILLPLVLLLSSSGPAHAQVYVDVKAHAVGGSLGSQPPYDLTEHNVGNALSTYTAAAEGGLADGFWSQCSTSASFGRVQTSVASANYPLTMIGSASCEANAWVFDGIIAAAPGVAVGEPMTYTAKVSLSTSTPGPMDDFHFVGVCIGLAGKSVCSDVSGTVPDVSGTVSVRVKTTAGTRLPLYLSVSSRVRGDFWGTRSPSAGIDKMVRLKMSSNKTGANITGESGYTYQ